MRLPLSRVRTGDCADGAFLAYPSQEESVKEAGNANSRSGVTPSARKSEEGKALLKKWGIEGEWIGVGHCILGYPAGDPQPAAPRKSDYILKV